MGNIITPDPTYTATIPTDSVRYDVLNAKLTQLLNHILSLNTHHNAALIHDGLLTLNNNLKLKDVDASPVGDLLLKVIDQILYIRNSADTTDQKLAMASLLTAVANGLATLDANVRLVQNANTIWDGTAGRSASPIPTANTIPVSDSAGRVDWNRPCFDATLSVDQAGITTAVATKITFDTETFDTHNNYDNATNYRFTPTIAGKYLLTLNVYGGGTSMSGNEWIAIYKNGISYRAKEITSVLGITNVYAGFISIEVDANGTTDYFEAYVYIQGTSLSVKKFSNSGVIGSFFSGSRVGI